MDNNLLKTLVNKIPRDYKNVKVYVADPWYNNQPGFIKNIAITNKPSKELKPVPGRVAYVLNRKNNCWWTCKGGPCAKICGHGGYCCRRGWKGCPSDMTAVATPNYHTCIRYRPGNEGKPAPGRVAYVLNGKNDC